MTRRNFRVFFGYAGLCAAVLVGTSSCQPSTPVSRGSGYFKSFGCVRCHSIGGSGGAYGPDLTYVGFRRTTAWLDEWLKNPHAWKSSTVMPNLNLPDHVRGDLVSYLAEQEGQGYEREGKPWNRPDLTSNPVERGAVIFVRAGCTGCHGIDGVGGNPNPNAAGGVIPSLRGLSEAYVEAELEERIRVGSKPGAVDPSKPVIEMPQWGKKLGDDEIDSLAAYLLTLEPVGGRAESADDW